jgi:hypothetical protein
VKTGGGSPGTPEAIEWLIEVCAALGRPYGELRRQAEWEEYPPTAPRPVFE